MKTPAERQAELRKRDARSLLSELERANKDAGRSCYAFIAGGMGREEYAELRGEVLRRMGAPPAGTRGTTT